MTKRAFMVRTALASLDFAVILFSFWSASALTLGSGWLSRWQSLLPQAQVVIPLYATAVVAAVLSAGLYRPRGRWSFATELRDMGRIGAGIAVLTLAALYLFKLEDVSRQLLSLFFAIVASGMFFARAAWRCLLVERRRQGHSLRRLLIVGSGVQASALAADVREQIELGLVVVGFVNDQGTAPHGHEWLGEIDRVPEILGRHVVDEVAVCLPLHDHNRIDDVVSMCREQGKDVRIPVRFMEGAVGRGRLEQVGDLAVLSLIHTPSGALASALKRALDVVVSAVLTVLLAPALAGVAMAVLFVDGRPVLFRQQRGGIHGREFTLLKFRTMVTDAEALRSALIDLNERTGPTFKITNDPRATRVGRFLRRTSLDELPQLLNVLRGDMSLVGPRPAIPHEIATYASHQRRRLSVKPGITGLWQVSARRDPDFERWVRLDLEYIDNWSVWNDMKLLSRTPAALVRQHGD